VPLTCILTPSCGGSPPIKLGRTIGFFIRQLRASKDRWRCYVVYLNSQAWETLPVKNCAHDLGRGFYGATWPNKRHNLLVNGLGCPFWCKAGVISCAMA
jgi:hypothetical protein